MRTTPPPEEGSSLPTVQSTSQQLSLVLLGREGVPRGSQKSGGDEEEWESKQCRDSFALSGSHGDSLPFTYGHKSTA